MKTGVPFLVLHHATEAEQVEVLTRDGDRFYLTVEAAIMACKDATERKAFSNQFDHLLTVLSKWIKAHQNDVAEAYITLRDASLLFLVVRKSREFNQTLEDSLTDLDIAIAQDADLPLINMSVLALPQANRECVESFLGVETLKNAK